MNHENFIQVVAALSASGRPSKNIVSIQRELERKPRDVGAQADLARAYFYADRLPEAVAQARKAYALDPSHLAARCWLVHILALSGAHDEAIEVGQGFLSGAPGETLFLAVLGISYAKAGREADARAVLKRMQDAANRQGKLPYMQAQVLAHLGDVEAAIDAFETAVDDGNYNVVNLNVDPSLRALDGNVRFVTLLNQLGLTAMSHLKV